MKKAEEISNIFELMQKQILSLQVNGEVAARLKRRREINFDVVKQKGDDYLFDRMVLNLFSGGMKASVVDMKWPAIKEAFEDFDIESIAKYDEDDLERLLNNTGIIRHRGKLTAVIYNARVILNIQKKYGSFAAYLESFNTPDDLVNDIAKTFKFMGKAVSWDFLGSIGFEAIKPDVHVRRIMHRIGFISSAEDSPAVYDEVREAAKKISDVIGERLYVIDAIIWYYGVGKKEEISKTICGKVPLCGECYIREYCDFYNGKIPGLVF